MNGYIINPMWFYWIGIADAIKCTMCIIAALLLVIAGTCFDIFIDEEPKLCKKIIPKIAVAGMTCLIIALFVPSKETLIEMQIAKYATWENAEWTINAIKDAVDYIVDAIGSIR